MTPDQWFIYGPLGGTVAILLMAVGALWKARESDRADYIRQTGEMTTAVREMNATLKTVIDRLDLGQQIERAVRAAKERG